MRLATVKRNDPDTRPAYGGGSLSGEDFDLSFFKETELEELNQQLEDAKDPVRYVIRADSTRDVGLAFYYNVSEDHWTSGLKEGTLFKRCSAAEAVLQTLRFEGRSDVIKVRLVSGAVEPMGDEASVRQGMSTAR